MSKFITSFAATLCLLWTTMQFFEWPERDSHYLTVEEILSQGQKDKLDDLADSRIALYNKVNADLDSSRYIVAILCCAGLALLLSKLEVIEIPFTKITVDRRVACWLLPIALLYFWLDFGYLLNRNIDSRIVSMKLIDASNGLSNPEDARYIKYHYTLSKASELEDNGLIDSWFWSFYKEKKFYPVERRGTYNQIIPSFSILWYAAVFGLLHALVFLLPYSIGNSKHSKLIWWLVILSSFVILFSHLSFSFAGGHWNWFQSAIFLFMLVFSFILKPHAEEHGAHVESVKKSTLVTDPEEAY